MPLRRADRLFDIIRVLQAASRPVTAAAIADELEVMVRTVYRDVATLGFGAELPAGRAKRRMKLGHRLGLPSA